MKRIFSTSDYLIILLIILRTCLHELYFYSKEMISLDHQLMPVLNRHAVSFRIPLLSEPVSFNDQLQHINVKLFSTVLAVFEAVKDIELIMHVLSLQTK